MSYGPDESNQQIYAEATWFDGAIVTAVLYGVVLVLSIMCWRSLWSRISSHDIGYRKNIFFFCEVTFLFVLGTIYVAFSANMTQLAFIENRLFPGGPSAYEAQTSSPPLNTAFVLSDWCADSLMIWRCIVVYRDTRAHHFIVAIGTIMFISSLVTGTIWLVMISRSAQHTTSWMSFTYLFPYLCVDLAINILISLLTVLRLLYHRHKISTALGPGHGTIYASFAAMIIESSAVYSICSLLYLIPWALSNPISNSFMQILGEAQIIAPLLIIYRVAEGKAWSDRYTTLAPSTRNDPLHMGRTNLPESAPSNPADVQIHFNTETTCNESIRLPESDHPKESTRVHASMANFVIGSAV